MLCASSRPSPVMTRSAPRWPRRGRRGRRSAPRRATRSPRRQRAVPHPRLPRRPLRASRRRPDRSRGRARRPRTAGPRRARRPRLAWRPFCGANTAAAPSGPCSGLVTSAATTMSVSCSRGSRRMRSTSAMRCSQAPPGSTTAPSAARSRAPSATSSPVPPSVDALPPRHTMMRDGSVSRAARIASPSPSGGAGHRVPGSPPGSRPSPQDEASSTTAVEPSDARRRAPAAPVGPRVVTGLGRSRPRRRRRGSRRPPSAIGPQDAPGVGDAARTPAAIAAAASCAVREPLNALGATRTRRGPVAVLPGRSA